MSSTRSPSDPPWTIVSSAPAGRRAAAVVRVDRARNPRATLRRGVTPIPNSGAEFADVADELGRSPLNPLRALASGNEYSIPAGLFGFT